MYMDGLTFASSLPSFISLFSYSSPFLSSQFFSHPCLIHFPPSAHQNSLHFGLVSELWFIPQISSSTYEMNKERSRLEMEKKGFGKRIIFHSKHSLFFNFFFTNWIYKRKRWNPPLRHSRKSCEDLACNSIDWTAVPYRTSNRRLTKFKTSENRYLSNLSKFFLRRLEFYNPGSN